MVFSEQTETVNFINGKHAIVRLTERQLHTNLSGKHMELVQPYLNSEGHLCLLMLKKNPQDPQKCPAVLGLAVAQHVSDGKNLFFAGAEQAQDSRNSGSPVIYHPFRPKRQTAARGVGEGIHQ